jgi:hypothetical protein
MFTTINILWSLVMKENNTLLKTDRRQFISTIIPACAFSCLGFKTLSAIGQLERKPKEKPRKHKFQKEWCHTYEEAFRWKHEWYIEIIKRFEEYLGKDKLIEMIKNAGDEISKSEAKNDPYFSFVEWLKGGERFQNMMTRKIIEKTDKVYEIKVSECLWTKIFQERDATAIGYALVCYNDFAAARAVNPKVKLERTKTLMQGHECCNHRWTFKG